MDYEDLENLPPPRGLPPNQGSGGKRVNDAEDRAAWVGIVSALLLFGREISGRMVERQDVSSAIDIADALYSETTVVCHARPSRAL